MKLIPFFLIFLLPSCGQPDWWGSALSSKREPASISAQALNASEAYLAQELQDKLMALHAYYVIGHMKLQTFDRELHDPNVKDVYASESYLKLLAVRTQTQEIENEIASIYQEASESSKTKDRLALIQKEVFSFSQESQAHGDTLVNLKHRLNLKSESSKIKIDFALEYQRLAQSKSFHTYEKTIDHLSHVWGREVTIQKSKGSTHAVKQIAFQSKWGKKQTSPTWKVDTLDWMSQDPEEIVKRTKLLLKKLPLQAGIIEFHGHTERTIEASQDILDYLLTENHEICKLRADSVSQPGSKVLCPQS